MSTHKNLSLFLGGCASVLAALVHLVVIAIGAEGYRALGAGEQMATWAEQGSPYPALLTLLISAVLLVWGLYAFSGGRYMFRMPWLRVCLVLITAVYCIRGIYGFFLPFVVVHPDVQSMSLTFWFVSSAICLMIGLLYLRGVVQSWGYLTAKPA